MSNPAPTRRRGPLALAMRGLGAVTQGMNLLGTGLILALMVLIGSDVIGRNLFGAPIPGVPELVTLSIVAIVFLQTPQTFRVGRVPQSSALTGLLRRRAPGAARMLDSLWDAVAVATVAVILYATLPLLSRAWERSEFIGALGNFTAPVWPVKATIIAGCALIIAQLIARIGIRHGWLPDVAPSRLPHGPDPHSAPPPHGPAPTDPA